MALKQYYESVLKIKLNSIYGWFVCNIDRRYVLYWHDNTAV